MSCFNQLSSQLSLARDYQSSARIYIWARRTWRDVFDWDADGLIRPQAVAALFDPVLFDNVEIGNLQSDQVENLICEKYKKFELSGFFSKLWMWFTEPVGQYKKIYTLITLRKLEAGCGVIAGHARQIASMNNPDIDALGNYFNNMMGFLGNCLSSLFPKKPSFFTKIFGNKKMFSHIEAIDQFSKKTYQLLKDNIQKSYITLADEASGCTNRNEVKLIKDKIVSWQQQYSTSLENILTDETIDEKYKKKNQQLIQIVLVKANLLSDIAESAFVKADSSLSDALSLSTKEQIDKGYDLLSSQIANIQDGCTLQIWDHRRLFDHTYVLDNESLIDEWRLLYYKTPQSQFIEINIEDIPGLGDLLSKNQISKSSAKELIAEYHHRLAVPVSITQHSQSISMTDPSFTSISLFQSISKQIENQLLEGCDNNNFDALEVKRSAGQLLACLNYLEEKNKVCITIHENLDQSSLLYAQLASAITNIALIMRKYCVDEVVFNTSRKPADILSECIESIQDQYMILQGSQEFEQLSLLSKSHIVRLGKIVDVEIHNLSELTRNLGMIHIKSNEWNFASIFGILPEKAEWEDQISNTFEQKWESMPKQEDASTRKILNDMAKDFFFHFLQHGMPFDELKKIYNYLETIRSDYVGKLQQETKTLVVSAYPEKLEIHLNYLVSNKYRDINETISELKMKLERNMKFHDERIALYSELLNLLVMRVEGGMWGVWQKNDSMDKRCGLIFAPVEKVKEEVRRLPWSHFIYTPESDIYYYCKQKDTIEKCCFLDPFEIEKFNIIFPERTYIKLLGLVQLKELELLISLGTGSYLFARDENRVTSRVDCELAEKEINILTRTMSSLYHPDKYSDGDKWQKFINNEKSAALDRLNRLFLVQKIIIGMLDKYYKDNSISWNVLRAGIIELVPEWIKETRIFMINKRKLINDCYTSVTNDIYIEEKLKASKNRMITVNEGRIQRIESFKDHLELMRGYEEYFVKLNQLHNENEQEQPQRMQAIVVKSNKSQNKNLTSKNRRGLKAVMLGRKHVACKDKGVSTASFFYSKLMNGKIMGESEKEEFDQKRGYR